MRLWPTRGISASPELSLAVLTLPRRSLLGVVSDGARRILLFVPRTLVTVVLSEASSNF